MGEFKVGCQWDPRGEWLLALRNGMTRLAYVQANALNDAAKASQLKLFDWVRGIFNVRAPRPFFGSPSRPGGVAGKIVQFASVPKNRVSVVIAVGEAATYSKSGLDHQRRWLLPLFEHGADVGPTTGARAKAIPVWARPQKSGPILKQFTFSAMQLKAYEGKRKVKGQGKRGLGVFGEYGELLPPGGSKEERTAVGLPTYQYKGTNRTFLLTHSRAFPQGGVFQRVGPGRDDIIPIWKFQPTVHIDTRLHAVDFLRGVFFPLYKAAFEKHLIETMNRHGGWTVVRGAV